MRKTNKWEKWGIWAYNTTAEAQRNDPDIHPVITQIKEERSPPTAQYPLLELE